MMLPKMASRNLLISPSSVIKNVIYWSDIFNRAKLRGLLRWLSYFHMAFGCYQGALTVQITRPPSNKKWSFIFLAKWQPLHIESVLHL